MLTGSGTALPADVAVGHEGTTLADGAEAVVLELHDHHRREVVVEQRHVDILGPHARHLVHALRHRTVPRGGEVVVGHLEVGEDGRAPTSGAAVRAAADIHRLLAQVPGPFGRGDDGGHGAVGLHGVVEQAERVADHARVEILVERQRVRPDGGRASDGVLALRDAHLGQMLTLGPVELHVAASQHGEAVARRHEPGSADEGRIVGDATAAVRAAAPAESGTASVHRRPAEPPLGLLQRHQGHAHLGLSRHDGRGRQAEGTGRTATAGRQGGGEPHFRHTENRGHLGRVAGTGIDGEPVEVLDGETGVVERPENGLAGEFEFGLGQRLAPLVVRGRTDADNGGLVFQRLGHGTSSV